MKYKRMWKREYSLWYFYVCHCAFGLQKKPFSFPHLIVYDNATHLPLTDISRLDEEARKMRKNLDSCENDILRLGKKHIESGRLLGESSGESAVYAHERFLADSIAYTYPLWSAFHIIRSISEETNRMLLKQQSVFRNPDLMRVLLRSPVKNAHQTLIEAVMQGEDKKELHERFKWISCIDPQTPPLTYEEFLLWIEGDHGDVQETAWRDLPLDENERDLVRLARRAVRLKDLRDDLRREAWGLAYPFFARTAEATGIPQEYMRYISPEEVNSLLRGDVKDIVKRVAERRKGYLLRTENGKPVILVGERMQDALREIEFVEDLAGDVSGVTGSCGKVEGTVRIIRNAMDLHLVREGDVLVAVTTHQDYVPAMKRAAAIVTDEGGITSHAAITARELRKPCIVGTGNATRVLQDNQRVAVDADRGTAKPL